MLRKPLLFPEQSRTFPGKRWLLITLRTLHLIGVCGLGGALLYPAAETAWLPYLWLTLLSGGAMMLVDLWSNGIWLLQLRGLAVIAKLGLLGCVALRDQDAFLPTLAILIISGVIAHAPGDVRYYSPWHRRRLDALT